MKWISVEDKLPPTGEPVLGWGTHFIPYPVFRVNGETGPEILDYADEEILLGLTHWMPLPEDPEE